jgi:two-component system, LytTR family, sensor kinase
MLLAAIPYWQNREFVIYRAGMTVCCFLATLVLHPICRWLWRRKVILSRAIVVVAACSYALGYACAAANRYLESLASAREPHSISWMSIFAGVPEPAFVLLAWSVLYFGVKHYLELENEKRRALAAEVWGREAELRALQYQIHPHFLFNTLNAISTLIVEGDGQTATRVISRLADFLRSTLRSDYPRDVSLEEELFFAQQYLEIEKTRLGDHFNYRIEATQTALSVPVPYLLLQPLIENAVVHGINPIERDGEIVISADRNGSRLSIQVTDNGPGITGVPNASSSGHGVGLSNADSRLQQIFGSDYRLELRSAPGGGCNVLIDIPIRPIETSKLTAGRT